MAAGARLRRWVKVLAVLALVALLGWWFVQRQLEPGRLTTTVLGRLGSSLALDIAFEGTPDYSFEPEPRLRVPNIVVTDPATGKLVLRAKRLEVSLPWSTVRGGDIVITRLELDEPVLDVDGLQGWLAARPEAPFKLPVLTRGLAVADGTVLGNGWSLEDMDLSLPRLAEGEPADLEYVLRVRRGETDARLRGQAHVDAVRADSRYSLQSRVELARATGGPLEARIDSAGAFRIGDDGFAVQSERLVLDGDAPLPELEGEAYVDKRAQLSAGFSGVLATWPEQWPALPPPIGAETGPFPLVLVYRGEPDLSDPLRLGLSVGESRLDARARVPAMLAWIDAPTASPLPPLSGTFTTPRLDFEGAVLRGVRAVLEDDGPPATDAPAPAAVP